MLAIEDLAVSLPSGAPLVRGVSFGVARGETVGLVGESGSGKSLTALAILRLLPDGFAATGRIRLDDSDLLALPEAAMCAVRGGRIGMVFQEPLAALDPLQRADRAVAEPLRIRGMPAAAARARADELLARVGVAADYPHRLSGGQRQRVVIAASLAASPDLLLADEPTTALDATLQAGILDLLASLVAERGLGLLLISHDLAVVARRTDRVLVMYAGSIVEQGRTATVFARLAHPYTRALFMASPHTGIGRPVPIPGNFAPAASTGCAFAPRCAHATARCSERPALQGDAAHAVACWHPR